MLLALSLVGVLSTASTAVASRNANPAPATGFITRRDSQLVSPGGATFRAAGVNIYWLGLDENVGGQGESGVRYPSHFRITDALTTVASWLPSALVRAHTVGVSTGNPLSFEPKLGVFNDTALDCADWAIAEAERLGLRLIVPLTDNYNYYHGGYHDFTDWLGLPKSSFYTDSSAISAFRAFVQKRLDHVNPYTGRKTSDEPAIAIWETGNELAPPADWTASLATFIKSVDANHLVMDGTYGIVPDHLSACGDCDVYSDHFYPPNLSRFSTGVAATAAAKRVYSIGEFGWSQGGPVQELMAACEAAPACAQFAPWSLFPHRDDYGFEDHNDGFTIRWPGYGFASELEFVEAMHNASAVMQGQPAPAPYPAPLAPNVTAAAQGSVAWRGAALAATYEVQRAAAASGPWTTVSPAPGPTDLDTPYTVPGGLPSGAWVRVRGLGLASSGAPPGPWSAPVRAA